MTRTPVANTFPGQRGPLGLAPGEHLPSGPPRPSLLSWASVAGVNSGEHASRGAGPGGFCPTEVNWMLMGSWQDRNCWLYWSRARCCSSPPAATTSFRSRVPGRGSSTEMTVVRSGSLRVGRVARVRTWTDTNLIPRGAGAGGPHHVPFPMWDTLTSDCSRPLARPSPTLDRSASRFDSIADS